MERALLDRLLAAGYLLPTDLYSGAFSIENRVNRNLLVIVRSGRVTLTCKRFRGERARLREVAALTSLSKAKLEFRVPRLLVSDDKETISASSPGLITLFERWSNRRPTARLARRFGRVLASLHSLTAPDLTSRVQIPFDPAHVDASVLDASPGIREMIRRIQDAALEDVVRTTSDVLTHAEPVFSHGDIRAHNVLVHPTRSNLIELIDWETSGSGSCWYDLGAGLAMFVELALVAGRGSPSPAILRAFLAGYMTAPRGQLDLVLVVRCAGLRLLQAAIEYASTDLPIPDLAQRLRIVGEILLRRPSEGLIHLGLIR